MAAKFDGKHARANMWVTHQNLARAKGGRPHYQPKGHRAPAVLPKGTVPRPADAEPSTAPAVPDDTTK